MANKFDEVRAAIEDAEYTLCAADVMAETMARILQGRLRKVKNYHVLRALKRELKNYDMRTGEWK